MILYLEIITTVSSVLAIKSGTEENLQRKKELWTELREKHFPPMVENAFRLPWAGGKPSRKNWKQTHYFGLQANPEVLRL